MTTSARPRSSLSVLADATAAYRDAAAAHSELRQALAASAVRLAAAQQVRDDAVRHARAQGFSFRELSAATGYSRGWLDRIVGHRTDRRSRHR